MLLQLALFFLGACCLLLPAAPAMAGAKLIQAPSGMTPEDWSSLLPHLLPEEHPVKKRLDQLFQSPRLIASAEQLIDAGFSCSNLRTPLHVVVASHPKLKGYLLKLFTDEQPVEAEWQHWLKRIQGAAWIRQLIVEKGYERIFKVPYKWIYLLPPGSKRSCLLVVEDMKLVSRQENLAIWSKGITRAKLDRFYDLLKAGGLFDSMYPSNSHYAQDGKIAFIDTEHYQGGPVRYNRLCRYLSKGAALYWTELIARDP